MSNNPMVDQVNSLLGDLLAGGGEVFLPEVGSLYPERRGARRLSKRMIQPPCRVVSFSSQQRGESLVETISRAAQCDPAEAQEIYNRWLHRVREQEVLTVEGVGVLKFKNFTPDAAFDKRLNPQGHEPVRVKPARRFDWALWVGIAAILVAAGFGGKEMLDLYAWGDSDVAQVLVSEPVPTPADEVPGAENSVGSVASETVAPGSMSGQSNAGTVVPETNPGTSGNVSTTDARAKEAGVAASTPNALPKETAAVPASQSANNQSAASSRQPATAMPQGTADAPDPLVSGRRYVVLGVFSTVENAARAAADAAAKEPAVRCGIYRFGEKFLVSPFEAPDAEACTLYIRSYGDRFPGLWTYTAR